MYASREEISVQDLFQAVLAQDLPTIKRALQKRIDPSDTAIIGMMLDRAVKYPFSAELFIEVKANVEQICAILKQEVMEIQEKKEAWMTEEELDASTAYLLSKLQEAKPGAPVTQAAVDWAEILQLSLSIMQNKQPGRVKMESIGNLFALQNQMFPASGEEMETGGLFDAGRVVSDMSDSEENQYALEVDRNFQIMALREQLEDLQQEIGSCYYRKENGKKGIYPNKMELLITSLEEKGRLADELEALESNQNRMACSAPKHAVERRVCFSEENQMCFFSRAKSRPKQAERQVAVKI